MKDKKHDDEAFSIIMDLVNEAFSTHYGEENPKEPVTPAPKEEITPKTPALYESIEDYTAQTGKRFRMTKDQKELGMTREEAFKLTFGDN